MKQKSGTCICNTLLKNVYAFLEMEDDLKGHTPTVTAVQSRGDTAVTFLRCILYFGT